MVRLLRQRVTDDLQTLQAVSIPQWCDCCLLPSDCFKHSKTSRVSIPQWCDCCVFREIIARQPLWFQSHNGAIAASREEESEAPEWFQSHNGAIAAQKLSNQVSLHPVSIPQWCDCCSGNPLNVVRVASVSIPQWCDCCNDGKPTLCVTKMVSIPQWCDCCQGLGLVVAQHLRFNPTMVRLLQMN